MKTNSSQVNTAQKSQSTAFFSPQKSEGTFFGETQQQSDNFFPVQTKLTIGRPNDPYEREADAMADQVVSGIKDQSSSKPAAKHRSLSNGHQVQHKCAACETKEQATTPEPAYPNIQRQPIFESDADDQQVQRKCSSCGQLEGNVVQRSIEFPPIPKIDAGANPPMKEEQPAAAQEAPAEEKAEQKEEKSAKGAGLDVPPPLTAPQANPPEVSLKAAGNNTAQQTPQGFETSLQQTKGSGQSLDRSTQQEMGQQFGKDFSGVRIHTGSYSERMNQSIGSKAFTNQNDIYFNKGQYNPNTEDGKRLLAHELTHTIHQGATTNNIQRKYQPPPQNVDQPVKPPIPNDGDTIVGNVRNKQSSDDRDKDDPPSRKDMRKEGKAFNSSGQTTPKVDQGKIAAKKSQKASNEIKAKVNEPTPSKEGEKQNAKDKKSNLAIAEQANADANKNLAQAQSLKPPSQPKAFKHPRIEVPVDKEGAEVPRDGKTDDAVRGLGYIGEILRAEGHKMRLAAHEQRKIALGFDAALNKSREETAYTDEGVSVLNKNHEERQKMSADAKLGLEDSQQRKDFVAKEAQKMVQETGDKQQDSRQLKQENSSKANQSKNNPPDDDEARKDAKKQNADLDATAKGTASIDQAISGANQKAKQFKGEADKAGQQNAQTKAKIQELDELLGQGKSRIEDINAKNEQSKAHIEKASTGPDILRKHALKNETKGKQLIGNSKIIEKDVNEVQQKYLDDNKKTVPGLKEIKALKEKAKKEKVKSDGLIKELILIAGMTPEQQTIYVKGLSAERKKELKAKLDQLIAQDAQQAQTAEQDKKAAGDGNAPNDERAPWYLSIQNQRKEGLKKVFTQANKDMGELSKAQKIMLAELLEGKSIEDDISSILTWQNVKKMLNPWNMAVGIVTGPWTAIKDIGRGFKDFSKRWAKDPLGTVLQTAASTATGIATLFSSITVLVGIIAGILAIVSFFFPPAFAPVPFLGSVVTFCGKGAIITGILAAFLNRLAYMKNISDAGSAETAEELFSEVGEMKENTYGELKGYLAIVEGYAGVKMGTSIRASAGNMKNMIAHSFPQRMAFLKQGGLAMLQGIKSMPRRLLQRVGQMFGKGRQGLLKFRNRLNQLFGGKGTKIDLGDPKLRANSVKNSRHIPSEELTPHQIKSELAEGFANGKVKRSTEPGYTIEVDLPNGVKYKRRKNGKWCRKASPHKCLEDDQYFDYADELYNEMPFQSDKEYYNFLKNEGHIDPDMSFKDYQKLSQENPILGDDISDAIKAGQQKPTSGDWSQVPNFQDWVGKREGRIFHNADGSYTLMTKDGRAVTYSPLGEADFSPYMNHPSGVTDKNIGAFVNDKADFKKANVESGHPEWGYGAPEGYTWHHSRPPKTILQLIPTDIHTIFGHTGKSYKP